MALKQRISLRKHIEDIRHWANDGKSDAWIASALGTSPASVQSFRSRNGIYRRPVSEARDLENYNSYEGVVDGGVWIDPAVQDDEGWLRRWSKVERVELRVTPNKIILVAKRCNAGAPGKRSNSDGRNPRLSTSS
jgi:hypothetical protein